MNTSSIEWGMGRSKLGNILDGVSHPILLEALPYLNATSIVDKKIVCTDWEKICQKVINDKIKRLCAGNEELSNPELMHPEQREVVMLELCKKRESVTELGTILWHSTGTVIALLQEIESVYPLLTSPTLTAKTSNRVCNALALLQCVASHADTRRPFLAAQIPLYMYPLLNPQYTSQPFEYLRIASLAVIAAFVNVGGTEVISFLISTKIVPQLLPIMEMGSNLSKVIATFIIQKMLLEETGLDYVCATAERVYEVLTVLANMVQLLQVYPSVRLLKHVVHCYLLLAGHPRAREELKIWLPNSFRNNTFDQQYHNDPTIQRWLEQLLIMLTPTTTSHETMMTTLFFVPQSSTLPLASSQTISSRNTDAFANIQRETEARAQTSSNNNVIVNRRRQQRRRNNNRRGKNPTVVADNNNNTNNKSISNRNNSINSNEGNNNESQTSRRNNKRKHKPKNNNNNKSNRNTGTVSNSSAQQGTEARTQTSSNNNIIINRGRQQRRRNINNRRGKNSTVVADNNIIKNSKNISSRNNNNNANEGSKNENQMSMQDNKRIHKPKNNNNKNKQSDLNDNSIKEASNKNNGNDDNNNYNNNRRRKGNNNRRSQRRHNSYLSLVQHQHQHQHQHQPPATGGAAGGAPRTNATETATAAVHT